MPVSETTGEALAKLFLFSSPGNAHPLMEFIDLLAEVPDSTESAQAARRERVQISRRNGSVAFFVDRLQN